MTIDEAIEQYKSNAEYERTHGNLQGCLEFRQLADWLKDYKKLKKQEPKTGHWIVDGSVDCYLDKVRCHCSECGKKKNFPADYNHINQELYISYKNPELIDNYCPNCGVKMIRMSEVKND